jgi:hypothetical protein
MLKLSCVPKILASSSAFKSSYVPTRLSLGCTGVPFCIEVSDAAGLFFGSFAARSRLSG